MNKFSKVQLPLSIEVNVDFSLRTPQILGKIYWMPQNFTQHSAVTQYIWGFFLSTDITLSIYCRCCHWQLTLFSLPTLRFSTFAWIDFIPRETRNLRGFPLYRKGVWKSRKPEFILILIHFIWKIRELASYHVPLNFYILRQPEGQKAATLITVNK